MRCRPLPPKELGPRDAARADAAAQRSKTEAAQREIAALKQKLQEQAGSRSTTPPGRGTAAQRIPATRPSPAAPQQQAPLAEEASGDPGEKNTDGDDQELENSGDSGEEQEEQQQDEGDADEQLYEEEYERSSLHDNCAGDVVRTLRNDDSVSAVPLVEPRYVSMLEKHDTNGTVPPDWLMSLVLPHSSTQVNPRSVGGNVRVGNNAGSSTPGLVSQQTLLCQFPLVRTVAYRLHPVT